MPQADIEINAVAASNDDLPIDTLVQLSNNDVGDETTYLWSIVSQPPGAADALSSTVIENPTITPKKEDTYLIQLIVDQGLPGEATDRKLFRIRRFKTDMALIAEAESIQGTTGDWATPQNENLSTIATRLYGGSVIVAQAGGAITAGSSVQFDETNTIKATLPGEERVPRVNNINATDALIASKTVGIAISKPDGSTTIILDDMVLVRISGFLDISNAGAPVIGDDVFVSDSGTLSLVQGTNRKKVGTVIDDTPGAWRPFLSTLTEEGGAHALGGGLHTADSLANFNSKVTGGNLDFDTAGRPGISDITTATGDVSTGSGADVLVPSMTITPAAGTYLVWFSGSTDHGTTNATSDMSIYAGGVKDADSERRFTRGGSAADVTIPFTCTGRVVVDGFQAIEGRWRTSTGTATMHERNLMILKVA